MLMIRSSTIFCVSWPDLCLSKKATIWQWNSMVSLVCDPIVSNMTCFLSLKQAFFALTSSTENEVFAHYIFMENAFSLPTASGFPLKFSLAGVFAPGAKGGLTYSFANVSQLVINLKKKKKVIKSNFIWMSHLNFCLQLFFSIILLADWLVLHAFSWARVHHPNGRAHSRLRGGWDWDAH